MGISFVVNKFPKRKAPVRSKEKPKRYTVLGFRRILTFIPNNIKKVYSAIIQIPERILSFISGLFSSKSAADLVWGAGLVREEQITMWEILADTAFYPIVLLFRGMRAPFRFLSKKVFGSKRKKK